MQWDGSEEAAFAVGAGRLPRPSRARARAHAAGRPRRPRRPRLRRAALRREHAPPARGRLVARPDLGARGRARRPPLEAGGGSRPAGGRRARGATRADRQRGGRRAGGPRGGDRRPRRARPRQAAGLVSRPGSGSSRCDRASSSTRRTATPPRRRSSSCSRATGRSSSGPTCGAAASTRCTPCARGASSPARRGRVARTPFRAGEDGLTLLAYGTREPTDVTYYPRSGKVSFRGLGLIGRLDVLDYWDGED